jgi:sialate O-acetylesterase
VWLGSGQSNMGLQVKSATNFPAESAAARYPEIRLFTVAHNTSTNPLADCAGDWKVCTPANVGDFSAALYFLVAKSTGSCLCPSG